MYFLRRNDNLKEKYPPYTYPIQTIYKRYRNDIGTIQEERRISEQLANNQRKIND